jgi:hypothetical protein
MQVSLVERFRGLWLGGYGALALLGDGRGGARLAAGALLQGMGAGGGLGAEPWPDLSPEVSSGRPSGRSRGAGVTTPLMALGAGVVAGMRHHDELQEGLAGGLELALGDRGPLRPWFEAIAWGVAGAIAAHPPDGQWLEGLLKRGERRTWGEPVQAAIRQALGPPLPLAPQSLPLGMDPNLEIDPESELDLDLVAPERILAATLQAIAQTGEMWTLAVQVAARTGGPGAALLTGAIAGAIGGAQRIDPDALLALDAATTAQAIAQGDQDLNRWAGRLDAIASTPGPTALPVVVLAPNSQVFRRRV